jgi:hypothetical protein
MTFSSFFRQRLNQITKHIEEPNYIRKYRSQRRQHNQAGQFRQYPLGRNERLSDMAGRTHEKGTAPRRYRPNSSEVYYDIDWFSR